MKMTRLMGLFAFLLNFLSACGDAQKDTHQSGLNYIAWSESSARASTIADVHKETLNLCLTGSLNPEDLAKAKAWTVKAALTWLRALVVLDKSIVDDLRLTCDQPDLTFRMVSGNGRSYASASVTTIYVREPFGTWSHELGHAFAALGDTYTGSTAGACQSGQPQSLMCWGGYGPRRDHLVFSTMYPDDILGIQENFRRLFGTNTEAPEWAAQVDIEKAFDPGAPWPGFNQAKVSDESHSLDLDFDVERLGSAPAHESQAL